MKLILKGVAFFIVAVLCIFLVLKGCSKIQEEKPVENVVIKDVVAAVE